MNAPLDADLTIHCITNVAAAAKVRQLVVEEWQLASASTWRNRIRIVTYQMEAFQQDWHKLIREKIRGNGFDRRVTLGGYYRILGMPALVQYGNLTRDDVMVYLDNDIVVMRNLQELMPHLDSKLLFQMGSVQDIHFPCSGFMTFNPHRMAAEFWKTWDQVDHIGRDGSDQGILKTVQKNFPKETGALPMPWDVHIHHRYHTMPQSIIKRKGGAAFLHFGGQRPKTLTFWGGTQHNHTSQPISRLDQYCQRVPGCQEASAKEQEMVARTWGLADSYSHSFAVDLGQTAWKKHVSFGS